MFTFCHLATACAYPAQRQCPERLLACRSDMPIKSCRSVRIFLNWSLDANEAKFRPTFTIVWVFSVLAAYSSFRSNICVKLNLLRWLYFRSLLPWAKARWWRNEMNTKYNKKYTKEIKSFWCVANTQYSLPIPAVVATYKWGQTNFVRSLLFISVALIRNSQKTFPTIEMISVEKEFRLATSTTNRSQALEWWCILLLHFINKIRAT